MSSSPLISNSVAAVLPGPLTIQTASLWASGDSSVFSGTGGPQGYDPWFGMFADVVTSAGIDAQPFSDQVWNVDAGDEVVFVVAVQNRSTNPVYQVTLRDFIPAGFTQPSEGYQLSVTDGAGNLLNFTGDLFSTGGIQLTDPVPAYDPESGANVVLLTFSLLATASIQTPAAVLNETAQIVTAATTDGGTNVVGNPIASSTPVISSSIRVESAADQTIVSLPSGRQASFDITITLPEGSVRDLRIDEIMPSSGNSWLQYVSAQVVSIGANLTGVTPVIGSNGSITFGNVTDTPDNAETSADQIVVRVTVKGGGTAAGIGTLQTVVSAADPNATSARWTSTVTNTLALEAPNVVPTISGTSGGQNATNTMEVRPFAAVQLADPDASQVQTLTIRLSDPLMGTLSGVAGLSTNASGAYVLTGSVDQVQAAARQLLFATGPGRSGVEQMTLTLDDGAGGVATDATTAVTVSAAAPAGASIQHFPLSTTGSVLTSTADGSRTVAQVETYQGPVDYLQSQFIYDGTAALAIVAQSPDVFIKSVAGSAAVQLLSGQNVVDAGHGSNFLLGGTGTDVFFLDARQPVETWDTIVGFTPGDIATLWGFQDGVSRYWWDDNVGSPGYTGRTLRADLTGSGHVDASITFAGTTSANTDGYALTTGSIGGNAYMTIFSL